MKKSNISLFQFLGFAITSFVGTLLHFLYDWSGKSIFTAPFSAVNESTWEHMKILFFPMFVFALIQSFFCKGEKNFWCIKCRGILLGILLIPVLFYTYNGIFGKSPDFINITIFFVAAAASYFMETRLFKKEYLHFLSSKISLIILFAIALIFILFTFKTPEIPLFRDPLTGTYGIAEK